PRRVTRFPYSTLFRSQIGGQVARHDGSPIAPVTIGRDSLVHHPAVPGGTGHGERKHGEIGCRLMGGPDEQGSGHPVSHQAVERTDRKSTRLNSSHVKN